METAESPTFVPTAVVPSVVRIDLACGQSPREGFEGADLYAPNVTYRMDVLKFPWPWADNSVDEFFCSHFIEHIPNREVEERDLARAEVMLSPTPVSGDDAAEGVAELKPRIATAMGTHAKLAASYLGHDMLFTFFDEMYRCLKKEGSALIVWPACTSTRAFQDPTHRRFISRDVLYYLNADWRKATALDHYPVSCNFGFTVTHTMPVDEGLRCAEVQAKRFNECWNTIFDFHATLKPLKP